MGVSARETHYCGSNSTTYFIFCLNSQVFNKIVYLCRTTPGVCEHIHPVEDCLRRLIPILTGRNAVNDSIRSLFSLPARLGGLGLTNPIREADTQYHDSISILSPIVESIVMRNQTPIFTLLYESQIRKNKVKSNHRAHFNTLFSNLYESFSDPSLKRCLVVASEKGASSWLTALPIVEHGFALHKGAFIDAISLRYGWTPPHLPSHCICGSTFSIDHAMNCKCGGFPSIRHNELRNITAELLTETSSNVLIEPPLQPLTGEQLSHQSINTEDNAGVDIAASNVWSPSNRAFFDVRVYNPFSTTYIRSTLIAYHRRNEQEKRRQYDSRIRIVEHGTFTSLVFTTAGGMGPAATTFYKRLASNLSDHHKKPYSLILNWIRCRLSFSFLRSAILCLHGARSSYHRPIFSNINSLDRALSEGRVAH